MKVLHAASSTDPAPGVVRQMGEEQAAADALGIHWRALFFVPEGTPGKVCVAARARVVNRVAFKREYYQWLADEMERYDLLVLRYLRYDLFQYRFLRRFRKPVILVHHTLEGPQIVQEGGLSARFKWLLDEALISRCHRHAVGLMAVTDEIAAYEVARGAKPGATWIYPNGILYLDTPVVGALGASASPEFLFVASRFVEWHGLDLVVESARKTDAPFTLHLVGELSVEQRESVADDARFVVHGSLPPAAVERIAAGCVLGLGSFALHRKSMHQACTLKVREYLRAGLPVYAGHRDVFADDFPWFRHGACDIPHMLQYAEECHGTERQQVASDARPWIDKRALLSSLFSDLSASVVLLDDHVA